MRKRSLAINVWLLSRIIVFLLFWATFGALGFLWENIAFGFSIGRELAKRARDLKLEDGAS